VSEFQALQRTSEAGSLSLDADVLHHLDNFFIELCAAIKDQVSRDARARIDDAARQPWQQDDPDLCSGVAHRIATHRRSLR
jgi:hypothetical protein